MGPMLAVLGRSWGLCARSWAALGAHVGGPRPSWDLCWRSWATLRAYVGGLGPLLGHMLAVLRCSWGLYGRSEAEKCEEHGYLENVLISRAGARSAAWGSVLSCSWSLCCWSWAALGAYVGGLGPLLGLMLAVLGRSWGLCWRSWGLCCRSWAALGVYVGGL